jgi:hypothetical protein
LFLSAVIFSQGAFPDDWPSPREGREIFSPSRNFKVRILLGKSYGDMIGSAAAPKGPYASAEAYKVDETGQYRFVRRFSLLNPVSPLDAFLTDVGKLITLDNWGNVGYGKVVVLYDANGSVIRAYTLDDLFPGGSKSFSHSVSSIWWRRVAPLYHFEPKQRQVEGRLLGQHDICVPLATNGRTMQVDLQTGEYSFRSQGRQCVPLW